MILHELCSTKPSPATTSFTLGPIPVPTVRTTYLLTLE